MMDQPTAMHVARIRSAHTGKDGQRREYESRLLRRTYRDGARSATRPSRTCRRCRTAWSTRSRPPSRARSSSPPARRRSLSRGRCRTGTSPRLGDGPQTRAARPCSARRAGSVTSRSRWSSPARCTRARSCRRSPGGMTSPSAPTSASSTRRPTRPTRRWTGCRPGRRPSRSKLARRHLAPGRTRPGWPVRPVVLVAGGLALPARGPRLLPRREERQGPDRVRAAHRP